MIKIIIALAFLCGAIFLGPRLADSQGFVHIATNSYIVETSLTTTVIIAVIVFLILHVLLNILFGSINLPHVTMKWFGSIAAKHRVQLQNEAFMAYEEGSYTRALSLLKKCGIKKLPTHCLFLCAKCAFETNDLDGCRKYLEQAESRSDSSDLACKLLRAKLNLQLDNTEAALENLQAVEKDSYNSVITTKLLYQCYEKEGNYEKIAEMLPNIKSLKIFDDETLKLISLHCLEYKLNQAENDEDVLALADKLSRDEKRDDKFVLPVIKQLLKLDSGEKASKFALNLLKGETTDEVYNAIALWPESSATILHSLEMKLQDNDGRNADNVALLQALANLEMKGEKVEEAKVHLDHALEVKATKTGYLLAAELSQRTNKPEEASKFMELALNQK